MYRIQKQVADTEYRLAHTNHENRTQEHVTDMEQRQIAHTNPENRAQEHNADTAWRQIACRNPENRAQEQVANKALRHNACKNPENRALDQVANTAQRRLAREQPGVLENEALWWHEIMYQKAMKFDLSSGTYLLFGRGVQSTTVGSIFNSRVLLLTPTATCSH